MSTDWDVHCLDCDVQCGIENGRCVEMVALARPESAVAIGALARLRGEVDVELKCDWKWVDVAWFETHATHRLIARNEYGECFDECAAYFRCDACGHQKKCHRPENHTGDHGERRDDAAKERA